MAGEKPNKRLLYSERAPGRMYDLYEHPAIADVYADGQGRILSGPQVTKIEFFRTTGINEEGGERLEQREVFLRLTLPTAAFVEAAGNALAGFGTSLSRIDEGAAQLKGVMIGAIKKVQDVKLP
jgi:hypothetical protein